MAFGLCSHVILAACVVARVVTKDAQGNFPLKHCAEENIDILSLFQSDIHESLFQQSGSMRMLTWHLLDIKSSGTSSQLMFAAVVDQFSANTETIDVSAWSFQKEWYNYAYRPDTDYIEIPITDIRTRLKMKIHFVERLFKEMSGVRKNVLHVGVVFLDGASLTQEQIIDIPSIVQQMAAEINILVVVYGSKLVEEIVHLTDTIILKSLDMAFLGNYLLMAMCKNCAKGWVQFEHQTGSNVLSCFKINDFPRRLKPTDAVSCSHTYGSLVVIETVEEMMFLNNIIYGLLKRLNMTNGNIQIGLRRDLSNYAKRFQWVTASGLHRPLLISHWLPRKVSRECINTDCVVWQFTNTWTHDNDNIRSDQDTSHEGFLDVNCQSELTSFTLCEVALPGRIGDADVISSLPISTEKNNYILSEGNFVIYDRNIVSVTANVGNPTFLQFLRDSNIDFPIFDCGEDAGDRRYIAYSLVCDFIEHCSNKQDELSCVNPRILLQDNELYCTSGQSLHGLENKCDNIKDCRDGSDEENCHCQSLRCLDGSCLPQHWVNDGEFDCLVYTNSSSDFTATDESQHTNMHLFYNKTCALICDRDTCVDQSQLNDGVKDCKGPGGPLDETIGKLEPANTCRNKFGYFIWAPKCHYIKDRYGGIIGCRNMSHLRDCENFECGHGYVKCLNSYCIAHDYLRDGKADCPTGEDENLFYTGPCTGYFACWDSNICLYPDIVCDGHPDCPHGDDEFDCPEFCPEGFRCIAGTVTVSDYNRSVPLNMSSLHTIGRRTRYLDLSGVEFHNIGEFISENEEVFLNLKVLILAKCNINVLFYPNYFIDMFPVFMIQKLDISYNRFETFSEASYTFPYRHLNYLNMSYNRQLKLLTLMHFSLLEILDISYTSLFYLNYAVFAKLPKLKHLNLSHTLISDFTRQFFRKEHTLLTLDLRGIRAEYFDDYTFHGLTISQTLYVDHFQICCPQIQGLVIKSHACVAPVAAISSCFNLLGLDVQRYLLWIVAILAVLGNLTVIVYRVIWDRSLLKTGYGLFVTNLGISDFIMGVYLFVIAGADYFYRDNYVLYDKNWRNSVLCKIAGLMACLSCEASTFFVFLITLDRFLVMKYPFGLMKCSRCPKTTAVIMSWVTSFLLSLVPIVFSFDIYSSNAMCLGLPLTNSRAKGWEFSVGVFIVYNPVMFLLIAYGQYAIFRAMSENRIPKTTSSMSRSRRAEDITVAKQLSLIVLSSFLCWFPVGLMGLMSFGNNEVSNEVYAWTTVVLLPINAAANPILYTIPALLARWEKFKHRDQRELTAAL